MQLRSVIVLLFVAGAALSGAPAQPVRDLFVIDGQRYVRSQQVPHALGIHGAIYKGVAAFAGKCAFAFCSPGEIEYAYLRHFDGWGNALHDEVIVDLEWSWDGRDCYVNGYGAETWVLWDTPATNPFGRVFDHLGQPVGETFSLLNAPPPYYFPRTFALTEAGAAVTIRQEVHDPRPHSDLYLRLFSPTGEPLSDLLPVATSGVLGEYSTGIAPLPDGGQVVGYQTRDFSSPTVMRGYLRRVHPDQTMDPPISVSEEQVWSVTPRLLSDGTLLVQYVLYPLGSGVFVQRYDANLVPLADPVAVDGDLNLLAAASDGSFVLAGNPDPGSGSHIWLRRYDASWQPLGERFQPAGEPPETDCRWFLYATAPVAYGDDGTIWVVWEDCGEGGGVDYLTTLTPFEPGDMNYDRRVDNFDITPFVMALADPDEYHQHYPGLPYEILGDVNEDGVFDNFDITPFVHLLTGQ
jgi:hypothetical protein